jgi:hypothetical protein
MPELILPDFLTCACRLHGRMIISLEPTIEQIPWQMEVYAKKLAYKVIGVARRAGVIVARVDLDRLVAAVAASPLPDTLDGVPPELCRSVARWNDDARLRVMVDPRTYACLAQARDR